jgi:hypothetical protein
LLPEHKHLDATFVAQNLIDRNPELKGGIKAIKQKTFKDTDVDKKGRNLGGARVIQFDGNEEFHRSLAKKEDAVPGLDPSGGVGVVD